MSWVYDNDTRILWIPSWFEWNPPESRDALKGYISDLTELPKLDTVDSLYNSLSYSLSEYDKIKAQRSDTTGTPERFSKIWADLYSQCRQSVPQAVVHQKQYQSHGHSQDHGHKPDNSASRSNDHNAVPVEIFLTYPCNGPVKEYALTVQQVNEWSELYDGIDIQSECKKALAWVNANKKRKKTARGMPAFLVGWLGRANDKGGRVAPEQTTDSGDAAAAWAIVHKRICGRKLEAGETTETPRIIHAVNIAGGWPYLRSINTDQVAYARRDFIAAYNQHKG